MSLYFPRLISDHYYNFTTPIKVKNTWRDFTRKLLILKYSTIDNLINNLDENIEYRLAAYKYKIITIELPNRIKEIKVNKNIRNIYYLLIGTPLPQDVIRYIVEDFL